MAKLQRRGGSTHTHTHVDGRERASRLSLLRIIEASKNRLTLEVLADCTVYRVKGVQSTNVTCISQSHSRRLIENGERRRQQKDESTRRNVQSFNTSKMRVNQFGRFNKSKKKKKKGVRIQVMTPCCPSLPDWNTFERIAKVTRAQSNK